MRVVPHTFLDVNNADVRTMDVANVTTRPPGRMVQVTLGVTTQEYCENSEEELLALFTERLERSVVRESRGTIKSIHPTSVVSLVDVDCAALLRLGRALLQTEARDLIDVLAEIVFAPTDPAQAMQVHSSEVLFSLGLKSLFIEASAIPNEVRATIVAVGAWNKDGADVYSFVPPPRTAPPISGDDADGGRGGEDDRQFLRVNLCCLLASVLYTQWLLMFSLARTPI